MRTVDGEAISGRDFIGVDNVITFMKGETNKSIPIKINKVEGWQPDENFYIELYDPSSGARLPGDNTRTIITIIDDDKPGNL